MTNDRSVYISTATTTAVLGKSGTLKKIVLTETAAGTITVYNNPSAASGEVIAVFKASIVEGTYHFGNRFCPLGITVVTAGASKLTVVFSDT